jgi:hypothetical protein
MDFNKYKTDLPWPSFKEPEYKEKRRAYQAENTRIQQMFKEDALKETGLFGHPKADKAFHMAWDLGHASGYEEVVNYLRDLAELLIED